jgi:hypothetical protein
LVITNEINGCKVGYTIDEMVKIFPLLKLKLLSILNFATTILWKYFISRTLIHLFVPGISTEQLIRWGRKTIQSPYFSISKLQLSGFRLRNMAAQAIGQKQQPNENLFLIFSTDLSEGCEPLLVLASAVSTDEQLDYQWQTDSLISNGNEQNFILPEAGKL